MTYILIMRGIPGSGKSHHVKTLVSTMTAKDYTVCSADNYFTDPSGKYNFNPSQLKEAHADCLSCYIEALKRKEKLVVVDNTNIEAWQVSPYVALADMLGVEYKIQTILCDWEKAFARNQHGVPEHAIKRMAAAIMLPLPFRWNQSAMKAS